MSHKVEQVKVELINVLKKHEIPALLATDILNTLSRDIVCYFNTKDMQDKYCGEEIVKRITAESDIGGKLGGHRVSYQEVIGRSR